MKRTLKITTVNAALVSIVMLAGEAAAAPPSHVTWAERIVNNVLPENNVYSTTPTTVSWLGERIWSTGTGSYTDPTAPLATEYDNSAVCNTFVTKVLQKAYDWDDKYISRWMGQTSPLAATYYDKIAASPTTSSTTTGWIRITNIANIKVGDIIAVKYLDDSAVTGHVMIVDAAPTPIAATKPIVTNTQQYAVDIIDSSSSEHGTFDTRVMPDGTTDTGAGRGTMRIYTDASGAFTGYTWSTLTVSTYYTPDVRVLTVGRLANTAPTKPPHGNGGGNGGGNGNGNGNGPIADRGNPTPGQGQGPPPKGGYDYPMAPEK